ncbi:MAG TPA: ATP-binding protein [Chitinophagaceae bacterium]
MAELLMTRMGRGSQYFWSLATIIVVSAVCFAFSSLMGYRTVAFILLVTVSVLAITLDILPVLSAAVLSAFTWNFFFIPPRFTFHVETSEDTILFFMYFIIAMINAALTYKLRQVEKASRLKEERANSVKLYNTILDSLTHELRTPIAAIIGATDNLQQNKNLSPENTMQLIAEISKASLRLNQQVENLLNISRLESGHIKPKNDWCDVGELIYEVVNTIEENNPGRTIHISLDQRLPLCSIDKGMLEQVVYNLLNNAVIHTPEGSSVEVVVNCPVDLLSISISDDGPGFRDIDVKDIFHKFSRNRRAGTTGSGLGLSIVKGFTEALGGSVEARNRPEGGARFNITIPVKTISLNMQA